ncbi:hypothetical protein ASZ90_015078 [hydrocarbon metagenome]|uniref:Zinc ribbon domain-containing protein n=1 Tax=hydrocarbon metagenome TaxID=938273 RepID=A0A0W8F311_9ZZZZ
MDTFQSGIPCPNCGRILPVEEGEDLTLCPQCGAASIVTGGEGARRVMVRLSVDEAAAREAFAAWLAHGWKARDLAANAEITELYPVYLPFWRMTARAQAIACGFRKGLRDIDRAVDLAPKVADKVSGSTHATGVPASASAGGSATAPVGVAAAAGTVTGGLSTAMIVYLVIGAVVLGGAVMASGILTPVYPDCDLTGEWDWGSVPGYGQVTLQIRPDGTFSVWSESEPGSPDGAEAHGRWVRDGGYWTLRDYDPADEFIVKTVTVVPSAPDSTRVSVKNPPFVPFSGTRIGAPPPPLSPAVPTGVGAP